MASARSNNGNQGLPPSAELAPEQLRALVNALPAGVLAIDRAGTIRLVNPALEQMFGYLPGELSGLSVELLVPPEQRGPGGEWLASPGASGPLRPLGVARELRGVRPDGSEFPVDVAHSQLSTATGELTLLLLVDISERSARERGALERLRALERSNADLEQFASIASHDLREPLRMVVSYTQLLGERYRGQLDEKADKFIGYAVEGALRMQRLIDDLLGYARLETAGRPSVPASIADALRDSIGDMRVLIDDSGAKISHGQLPIVLIDPIQLAQLMQNLIHNAIKFRRDEPPRVHVFAEPQGALWRISVEDNGIGIEPRYHDRIFQMFQRLHERSRYEGNGIGLATAKRIVERHGGTIGVSSTPGRGSTFYFTLPAATPHERS